MPTAEQLSPISPPLQSPPYPAHISSAHMTSSPDRNSIISSNSGLQLSTSAPNIISNHIAVPFEQWNTSMPPIDTRLAQSSNHTSAATNNANYAGALYFSI
ncbi:hypothetical protein H4R22_002053 [Coemansia sp. RSA 1290]|nr:hypothetical protein H4R22_002053 [Coemansia sp. RSA 1290]